MRKGGGVVELGLGGKGKGGGGEGVVFIQWRFEGGSIEVCEVVLVMLYWSALRGGGSLQWA